MAIIKVGDKATAPSVKPILNLDFANSKVLDPRIEFTRSGTATYWDGKSLAKAEENLAYYTNDFSSWWSLARASLDRNTIVAPDGTTTASRLTQSGTTTYGPVYRGYGTWSEPSNTQFALSVFAKYGTSQYLKLLLSESGVGAVFDMSNGTVATTSGGTASIDVVGGGWYRLSFISAGASSQSGFYVGNASSATTAISNANDGEYTDIWGAQIERRDVVTPYVPRVGTITEQYQPVMQTALANEARFDHNSATGESKGLLIEESRTNLLSSANNLGNFALTNLRENSAIGLDGQYSVCHYTDTADGAFGQQQIQAQYTTNIGSTYTFSIYAKADRSHAILIRLISNDYQTIFGSLTCNLNPDEEQVEREDVGNGWFRFRVTGTNTSTATTFRIRINITNGNGSNYNASGIHSVYMWGPQLEAGAYATSYIPTTGSQVTRASELARIDGDLFDSIYNPDQFTLYGEGLLTDVTNGYKFLATIGDGTTSHNSLNLAVGPFFAYIENKPTVDFTVSLGAPVVNEYFKMAGAVQRNNIAGALNGYVNVDNSGMLYKSRTNAIYIGRRASTDANFFNGHIQKLSLYDKRLPDAEIQALTEE